MTSTKFKIEVIFGDAISKDSISPEQITKLDTFFDQNNVNIYINIKINFLNLKRRKILIINRVTLHITNNFKYINDKDMVCWW